MDPIPIEFFDTLLLIYKKYQHTLGSCTHVNVITRMQHVACCVYHELFQVYRVLRSMYKHNFDMLLIQGIYSKR